MNRLTFGRFALGLLVLSSAASPGLVAPAPDPKVRTTPFIQWTIVDDFESNDPHCPLVVNDNVIVGTDKGELRAYRRKDGAPVWTYQDGARIFNRSRSDGERIFFASANGLMAVTAERGEKIWNFGLRSGDGPVIALAKRGLVYVGGSDGNLYAVDAKTGNQVWTSDFVTDAPADPPGFPGNRARMANAKARPATLATDGDTIFLSVFDQSRVVAIDAANGKRLWSFQAGGWIYGAAVTTDRHLFFGSQDEAFYCLDKRTGKQIWKHPTKGRIESGGAVDEEWVYFASCDGGLYCLRQTDGQERWRFAIDHEEGQTTSIHSFPILREGVVYFAAEEGHAYGVDKDTGALKWKILPIDDSELGSPVSDGERFFVVTRARDKEHGRPSLVAIGLK